jgi:hypothetical protein
MRDSWRFVNAADGSWRNWRDAPSRRRMAIRSTLDL